MYDLKYLPRKLRVFYKYNFKLNPTLINRMNFRIYLIIFTLKLHRLTITYVIIDKWQKKKRTRAFAKTDLTVK